ncbi:anthranilate synthase component I family protein [Roseimaritima sediminicola]|uniref:anthranilate synthase component I family protein n=1 Tax=Roseimaritima sediminicola TaxID=2662066 RepID=UPI0012983FFF|nr:anthranilate synthase component I family protein [Roseimaritima sediminicola]
MPDDFSFVTAFQSLADLPGVLWLDSATNGPDQMGRYSFLSADPVERLRCDASEADGWTKMCRWLEAHLRHSIPATAVAHLPPFQGGIAGVWGYEAASWIESVGRAAMDDLPTPPICLGLYDWVIAWDHQQRRGWLISQGLPETQWDRRLHRAVRRADQVMAWLQRREVRPADAPVPRPAAQLAAAFPTPYAGLTSNFTGPAFQETVAEIVARIRRGDSFQVNIAQRLLCPQPQPSPALYLKLRASNPAPLAGYYDGGDFQLLSSSPEGFLRLSNRQVETRPIKGTTPRTGDAARDAALAKELYESQKDRAENVMIVDLMRNDLSRVCDDQSVRVEKLCEVEPYAFVQHLVSVVRGTLDPSATLGDLLTACFPGGSVTGAPKVEAMRTIAQLEPTPRGPYCGSLGYISCGGAADFNILIRSATAAHGWLQFPVGGGITARSDPYAEEQETWHKAEGMLRALVSR